MNAPRRAALLALLAAAVALPSHTTGDKDGPVVARRPSSLVIEYAEPMSFELSRRQVAAAQPYRLRTPPAVRTAPTPPRRPAPAVDSETGPYRPGWEARHGHQALALISYPWQDLGWQISFHPARRGLLGQAHDPDRHIYIFVRRSQSVRSLAFTIAHEIGHAYDFTHGTRESHNRWLELRGIDSATPWFGCNGCGDLETPAGDFAEVFAVWQVGPVDFRSRIAPLPQGKRLRVLSQEFLATGTAAAAG